MLLEISYIENRILRRSAVIGVSPFIILGFIGIVIPYCIKESLKHKDRLKILTAFLKCELKLLKEDITVLWK